MEAAICMLEEVHSDVRKGRTQTNGTDQHGGDSLRWADYQRALAHGAPDPVYMRCDKLVRWNLLDVSCHPHELLTARQPTPARMADKSLQHLHRLRQLVPPRVVYAVFSTI